MSIETIKLLKEPFHLLALSAPASFLLFEDLGFHIVACEDLPGDTCGPCGHLHLIPPVDILVRSEFLSDEEAEEYERSALALSRGDEEMAMAVELHDLLEARGAFAAAAMRARFKMRFEDDPDPSLLLTPDE